MTEISHRNHSQWSKSSFRRYFLLDFSSLATCITILRSCFLLCYTYAWFLCIFVNHSLEKNDLISSVYLMFSYQDGSVPYRKTLSCFIVVLAGDIARTDLMTQTVLINIFWSNMGSISSYILINWWNCENIPQILYIRFFSLWWLQCEKRPQIRHISWRLKINIRLMSLTKTKCS